MAQNIKGYIQAKINLLKKKADEFAPQAQQAWRGTPQQQQNWQNLKVLPDKFIQSQRDYWSPQARETRQISNLNAIGDTLSSGAGKLRVAQNQLKTPTAQKLSPVGSRMLSDATGFAGSVLESYANTAKRSARPSQQVLSDLKQTPNPIRHPLGFLTSPQGEDILNYSDVYTLGAGTLAGTVGEGLLKKGGKKLAKEGAEDLLKRGAKKEISPLAEQALKKLAVVGEKVSEIDRKKLTGLQLDATNAKLEKAWGTTQKSSLPQKLSQETENLQRIPYQSSLEGTVQPQQLKTGIQETGKLRTGLKQEPQAISDQISKQRQGLQEMINTESLKFSPNQSSLSKSIPPVVKQEVQAVENAVKKKVNILDYMRTPDRVLEKVGLKHEADLLKKQYNSYLDQLPKEIDKVTEWYNRVGKSDEASTRIFRYLDGQPQQLQGEELVVANEIKSYLADWADKLQLPHDKRILHYITHIFDPDFIKKEFDPDLAKLITDKIPSSVYDPFLQERLGKMGYKENVFEALDAYVKRATRKYNMDPALDQLSNRANNLDLESLKYVTRLGERINLRPTELDNLLDNMVKSSPIGYKLGQRPVARVSRSLRQAVYRGTLGLNVGSSIRNLTQGVNTYAQLGEKYTGIGYAKALKAIVSKDDELVKSGVLRDQIIQDRTLSATKQFWEKTDRKLFVFFDLAEKINRGAAYFGAKSRALARGASEAEAVQEGVDMARKTQFTFGRVDTPVALQSDLVKIFAQFQSFNIKQTEFLSEMVKKKEFAGMARWLGANMVILYTFGKAMGWDWKDMVPFGETIGGERPLGQTPPVKLVGDVAKMAMGGTGEYGQPITAKDIGKDLVPFFPAGTQLKKSIEGLGAYNRGYSQSASGLVRYPVPKTMLNVVKTGVLGQYSTPEARDYFDKKLTPLSEKQSELFKSSGGTEYYNKVMDRRLKKRKEEQPNLIDQIKEKLGVPKAQAAEGDTGILMYDDGEEVRTVDYTKFTKPNTATGVEKYKWNEDKVDMARKIYAIDAPDVTVEQKNKAIESMGLKPDDVKYDYVASQTADVKYPTLMDELKQLPSREEMFKTLVRGRKKSIGGKRYVSDDVVDRLYNDGYLSSADKKALKAITDLNGAKLQTKRETAKKPKKLTVKKASVDTSAPAFASLNLTAPKFKPTRTALRAVQPVSEATLNALRNPSLK